MGRARANGIEIEYDAFGSQDAPPVLLISGLGTQMTRWATPFCETLASRGFRVIRFDNRDVGLSTHFTGAPSPEPGDIVAALMRGQRPPVPYLLQDMADDAVGLLDALAIARAHVVGRSMGGMIGQLIASSNPERVISLTSIMSSSGRRGLPEADPAAMSILRERAPDPAKDEAGYLAHAVKVARFNAGTRYPFDEAFQRSQALAEARRAYDPSGAARQLAAVIADGDRSARLKKIVAPTLVIHGDADRLVSLAAGQDTAAQIRGAEFRLVEGMGHEIAAGMYEDLAEWIAANARRG